MKRLHVSLAVDDMEAAARFYSALFAAAPTVLKPASITSASRSRTQTGSRRSTAG